MRLDVLLINPGASAQVYQGLADDYSAIEPPSLAGLFATYLRGKGLEVAIIDAAALNLSPVEAADYALTSFNKPTLIVVVVYGFQPSASTQSMTAAGLTCAALKQRDPNCKILMTGTHPAALPERTMREEAVDFVCSGEGPVTIWRTALALRGDVGENIAMVPGLWYRWLSSIRHTTAPPLMTALDAEMPGAAWDLLPMERYRSHNWHAFGLPSRAPYASIHTSLGCPWKCHFCCINAPFGGSSYRMWSPDAVIKEIDLLVNKHGVRNIKFVDEMFVLNRDHVMGICDRIIARGYDLNIWAYARVDTVKNEFLDKLHRAGFRWLALGIESASKHVRDGVEKGRFGSAEILQVVRKIQAAGINVIGNYIFGLPDDTHKTMQDTLNLALEANCEFANFYCAMAYPGSRLYATAIEKGWALPAAWSGYSQHSYDCTPLATETLTGAEVLRFRDAAFHTYFTSTRYLDLVRSKFGQGAVDHLQGMTTIKLKRQLLGD